MDAVLVVNSANVVCLCAEESKNGGYHILAEAQAEYGGIKKNTVPSATGMAQAMKDAMDSAQLMTGKRLRSVTVGVPGIYTGVKLSPSETPLDEDLLDTEYEFLYSTPVLRRGDTKSSSIMALREYTSLVNSTMKNVGINVKAFVSQSQCEGLYLIPPSDRAEVAIMIDVGYYITDVCVFNSDALLYSASLYVGGSHMAKDLAQVLEISNEHAEQLRRQYTFGIAAGGSAVDYVRMPDGKLQPFEHALVGQIIQARVEEICALISTTINSCGIDIKEDTKAYLTGEGLAPMSGSREYLSAQLGRVVPGLPIDLSDGTTKRDTTALSLIDRLYKQDGKASKGLLKKLFQRK